MQDAFEMPYVQRVVRKLHFAVNLILVPGRVFYSLVIVIL